MKIVQLIPLFEIGGAQRMVLSFTKSMIEAGHDTHVVILRPRQGTFLEDELDKLCDSVYYLNKPQGFHPKYLYKLFRTLNSIKPDIIHSHMYSLRYLCPYIASRCGTKFIHTIHNTAKEDASKPYWFNFLFQRLLFTTRVTPVSISKEINESVKAFYRIQHCHNIYNGIDIPKDIAIREKKTSNAENCVFISVATFKKQKNHFGLLKFFKKLLNHRTDIYLKLIGDGPMFDATKKIANDLGIEQHVEFMGARSDVEKQLNAADIFILLSHHEGNPLSVMEAMAARLPVIATRVGGIPDLITDGVDGITISSNDSVSNLSRVLSLISNPAERQRIGDAARSRAEAHFSDEAMSHHYIDLYEKTKNCILC